VDGAVTPMMLTTNTAWTMAAANGLADGSTHSFQLDYTTTDGRRSPISPSASGTTWLGYYWGTPANAIPVEWMTMYFGPQSSWPSTTADSDGDGMNNYQEFLAGTNPTNSASVLRVQISKTSQGAQPQQLGHCLLYTSPARQRWNDHHRRYDHPVITLDTNQHHEDQSKIKNSCERFCFVRGHCAVGRYPSRAGPSG